jgi:hypothetical protein
MSKPSTCLATEVGGVDILMLDPWMALQITNKDGIWIKHPYVLYVSSVIQYSPTRRIHVIKKTS